MCAESHTAAYCRPVVGQLSCPSRPEEQQQISKRHPTGRREGEKHRQEEAPVPPCPHTAAAAAASAAKPYLCVAFTDRALSDGVCAQSATCAHGFLPTNVPETTYFNISKTLFIQRVRRYL